MKMRIATVLAGLLFALAGVFISQGTANAVWSCRTWTSWPNYAYGTCDYGVGGERVVGDCWYQGGDYIVRYYGPWQPAGQVSTVICNGGSLIVGKFLQTF